MTTFLPDDEPDSPDLWHEGEADRPDEDGAGVDPKTVDEDDAFDRRD